MKGCMDVLYNGEKVFEMEVTGLMSIEEAAWRYLGLEDNSAACDSDQRKLEAVFGKPGYPFVYFEDGAYRVHVEGLAFGHPSVSDAGDAALTPHETEIIKKIVKEVSVTTEPLERELDLLEEMLIAEKKKLKSDGLTPDKQQEVEERIDSLWKIAKIVHAESHAMTEDSRKSLASVTELLLKDAASAHVQVDADGKIEVMIRDSIHRKVLGKLEIKKSFSRLLFESVSFCE